MIYLVRTRIEVKTGLGLPFASASAPSTGSLLIPGQTLSSQQNSSEACAWHVLLAAPMYE